MGKFTVGSLLVTAIAIFCLFIWVIYLMISKDIAFEDQCVAKGGKALYLKGQGYVCAKKEYFIEVK